MAFAEYPHGFTHLLPVTKWDLFIAKQEYAERRIRAAERRTTDCRPYIGSHAFDIRIGIPQRRELEHAADLYELKQYCPVCQMFGQAIQDVLISREILRKALRTSADTYGNDEVE